MNESGAFAGEGEKACSPSAREGTGICDMVLSDRQSECPSEFRLFLLTRASKDFFGSDEFSRKTRQLLRYIPDRNQATLRSPGPEAGSMFPLSDPE